MANYKIGEVAVLRAVFATNAGAAIDPTTVRVFLRPPSGVETIYTYGVGGEVVKDSVGNYHYDFLCATDGDHYYRWVGTGVGAAADEKSFKVKPSVFAVPL